jgi:hypothetical protein
MRAAPSDGGRGPATERHAWRPAPNNIAESCPDSLMRINLLKIETTA